MLVESAGWPSHWVSVSLSYFGNPALNTYDKGVIPLNQLRGPTVLGYMYGGIYSTVPATTTGTFSQTGASNQVFQITLTPT